MSESPGRSHRPQRSPGEGGVARSRAGEDRRGTPIPTEELHRERTVENYLRGAVMPRWMERLRDIASGTERHRAALARDHAWLREQYAEDPAGFAREWRALVQRRSFEDVNDLIRDHNQW